MLHRVACFLKIAVVTAIALAFAASASADQPLTGAKPPEQRSRDVLARIDEPLEKPGWITLHLAADFSNGFRISRSLSYGNRSFDLRLRGPVFKTPVRGSNYGLKLELKF